MELGSKEEEVAVSSILPGRYSFRRSMIVIATGLIHLSPLSIVI